MNGVIYARYSSDNQREESIEGQLRECKEFANRNDITIVDTYIDRAFSAKTDNRPSFQKMIRDSSKNQFDVIIVWKLDRFARNRYDSAHYKAQLRRNGVKVVSATEAISEGAEGIILESVLEGMAEYYSAELAEKVIRGQTENAMKCKFNGGPVTFGYYIDDEQHFQIDEETAPYITRIYNAYDSGMTMKEIAEDLNNKGVSNSRGGKFTINIISKFFQTGDISESIDFGILLYLMVFLILLIKIYLIECKQIWKRINMPQRSTKRMMNISLQQNFIVVNVSLLWLVKAVQIIKD